MNKTHTSDKETFILDLNIKVIGSDIHTSVYDERDDFGFTIFNFPWLSGDVVVMVIPAFTTNAMTSDFLSSISPD